MKFPRFLIITIGFFLIFPYFNADRLQLKAMESGDGDLAIKVVKMFPESVLRYQIISNELLQSNLFPQSLDVARSGVKFNPRSANIWIYVLVNPAASLDEREKARQELMNLDPLNKEIQNYLVK